MLSHWSCFPVVPLSSKGSRHPQERVTVQLCSTGPAKTSLQAGTFMFCKQQWKEGCNLPELITSWATLLYKYWRTRRHLLRFFFSHTSLFHSGPQETSLKYVCMDRNSVWFFGLVVFEFLRWLVCLFFLKRKYYMPCRERLDFYQEKTN